MKGNLGSSKKKKTIALIATVAVLLAGAVTGVTLFLKDDGSASATDIGNQQSQGTNIVPDTGAQNNEDVQTPNDETEVGEQVATGEQNEGENVAQEGSQKTSGGQTGTNRPTAVGGVSTNEPVQPQEFVTYRDRLVSEDFLVGWTPISLATIMPNTNGINRPILEISKQSYTVEPKYNAVAQGEAIFYEITVANVSKIDAESIRITDKVPQGTTLEQIDELGKEENGLITWILDIPAGTQVTVKFMVSVNKDAQGSIENTAIVNGEETNKVENPVIIASKASEIYRNGEKIEAAKIGDTIKYTINIKNTGNVKATTKVTDKVPEGTTLVAKSLKNAKVEDETIIWDNVQIPAGEEKTVEFEVTINKDVEDSVKNIATVSQTLTNEVEDKIKIIDKVGNKVWANDAEILRADVQVELFANGKTTNKILTLTANNNWKATFIDLPKYDSNGKEIAYTVKELTKIEGYTSKVKDMTITNTYEEPTVDIPVTKVWVGDNEDLRPESITVQLLADGEKVEGKTLELNANNNWTATFEDLQKYHDLSKTEFVYSVEEVKVPEGYTSSVEGMTITNRYEEPTVDLPVAKVWVGDNETLRPESITAQLLADGEEVEGKTLELNANNNWTATFEDLQKYHDLSKTEIVYSVAEVKVPEGYTSSVEGMTITNTYEEPQIDISVKKQWVDDEKNTVLREAVAVEILNGTETVKRLILNQNNGWQDTVEGLQKYETGTRNLIEYKLAEKTELEGYITTYSKVSDTQGVTTELIVTNTYSQPKVNKTAIKTWTGDDDSQIRPENIEVKLLADGKDLETVILNKENEWQYEFKNLPKYVEGTITPINYSIIELTELPEGYECIADTENPMHITNKYTQPKTKVPVEKIWEHGNNQNKPTSVVVKLTQTGETITLNSSNSWKGEFTDLPKYKDEAGVRTLINYSIEEVSVPNQYEESIDGFKITNTYKELDYHKTSDKDGVTVNLGDTIKYTITIENPNNKNVATFKFQDTVPANTSLVGSINVTTGGTTTTLTQEQMEKGHNLTVPGKGKVTVEFTVKVLKTALGTPVTNTAKVNEKNTETITTTAQKGLTIHQIESTGQKAIIIIDMSLSMASAITPPEDYTSDTMAFEYTDTRWYALTEALDDFVESFFSNPKVKNQLYIYGYNGEGVKLMDGFATTEAGAKAAYAGVFTKDHFDNVIKAAQHGATIFDAQADIAKEIEDNSFESSLVVEDGKYYIDVDSLTYLGGGTWYKDVANTDIKAGELIENAKAVPATRLASKTEIETGLAEANEQIANLKTNKQIVINQETGKPNVSVILMSDGEDKSVEAIQTEAAKIKAENIDLYTVAFTGDADTLPTNVGTENITEQKTATTAGELKTIFANIAINLAETKTDKTTITKYIDLSGITIPDDADVTIYTGTAKNPTVIETSTGSVFKSKLTENKFEFTAFLKKYDAVKETDTINIEIYTKK